ncbi:MAG: hypothetical protein K0Q49_1868 [Haloplasmataceae bacterium]|nr:hypothetical protein [Haloplasmataceae bacterium]
MIKIKEYLIEKILSNNVVLVDDIGIKLILLGKGIGFGKKTGDVISNQNIIEEKFISLNKLNEQEQLYFIDQINPIIIELTEQIITLAQKELKEEFSENIHLGLIDHINYAIKRLNEGIEIVNPFLLETKLLYPHEYALAEKAVNIMIDQLNMLIPEAEIGFIALHFCGGRKNNSRSQALSFTKLIKDLTFFLESKIKTKINENSYSYSRFVIHLHGIFLRVINDQPVENVIMDKIKHEFAYEISLARSMALIIERQLKKQVPESEIGYIAIHLSRFKINN